MRKFQMFFAALLVIAAFSVANLMANPAIMKKHAGKSKGDKKVNCAYCHNTAKIEKKAGQDVKALEKNPACLGSGCHQ